MRVPLSHVHTSYERCSPVNADGAAQGPCWARKMILEGGGGGGGPVLRRRPRE